MNTYKQNFSMGRGVSFTTALVFTDRIGHPIVTPNWTARLQIVNRRDTTLMLELNAGNGGAIFDAAGRLSIHITPTQSALIPIGSYDFTLYYSVDVNNLEPVMEGQFVFTLGVVTPP